MAITKTDFINYTRCNKYVFLEDLRKEKLESKETLEEYLKYERETQVKEMISLMFDEEDEDLTEVEDPQLEALLDYYKEVELLAGKRVENIFNGKTIYNEKTYKQQSFDFVRNAIRYLCYVDIYNENDDEINIIEVKATTSKKMLEMTYGKDKIPLFINVNGIYEFNKSEDEDYYKIIDKLKNRFKDGKYIYDLAVQRYIVEHDSVTKSNKKINYFLAVLNHEYEYDGYTEDGKRVYRKDENGNDIISIFNMNDITMLMQDNIERELETLEKNIMSTETPKTKVGIYCALKGRNECRYKRICFKNIPKTNASYNYKRFVSFKDEFDTKYDKYDLINEGYYKLDDIPRIWLKNPNHIIQRDCYDNNEVYINKEKIKVALEDLKYPIYHLDFETFPCPLPRFRKEKCYTQSPFEFSLHIERYPGVCDKDKDNYVFMAKTSKDERLDLVKALIEHIPMENGVMLAQNVRFEKSVIKHLSEVFPEYKTELMKIYDSSTDLLYIIENNKEFYKENGFNEFDINTVNYYNNYQSGSYSIKKTLPLFSNLKYSDLEVQNGTEALVVYSKFDKMENDEIETARKNLIDYCKQDTWAMVEILRGLRETVK
jgi:hypothetical protein